MLGSTCTILLIQLSGRMVRLEETRGEHITGIHTDLFKRNCAITVFAKNDVFSKGRRHKL